MRLQLLLCGAVLLLLRGAASEKCRHVSGEWINSKGSILHLKHHGDTLHGSFQTAVELSEGSAGTGAAPIRGFSHDGLVSFSVKYNTSAVAFTGHCYSDDDGKDTIHISWLLTEQSDSCEDHWMSNRIGQDKFVRHNSLISKKKLQTS